MSYRIKTKRGKTWDAWKKVPGVPGARMLVPNFTRFVPFATAEVKPPFEPDTKSFCRVNDNRQVEFLSVSHFLPDWTHAKGVAYALNSCVHAVLEDFDGLYPTTVNEYPMFEPSGCCWDLEVMPDGNNLAVAFVLPLDRDRVRLREYVKAETVSTLTEGLTKLFRKR